ncbi:thiamine phosphate synthase [Methanospirillum lacunae]|uniref:Thiamine-phosphate synthase n=1 Tax=Methanospirillum lacunae TaxID=668570 RepID=A0A2V2N6T7_9EURY|nr:thiamine phosphate synthase [Methanospirillum lacunae]PWR72198.1 thiamine phosphate synthase [Methanospirillum lacunae]
MSYELYVVTDEELSHGVSHVEIARQAVAGGADVIQLRDKKLPGRDLFRIACDIRAVTAGSGALFIVNDRLDIALASNADGVHIGKQDLPLSVIRPLAPSPFIIGVSVSSVEQAKVSEEEGADYVAISPVFSTGSKHDAGPGLGLGLVREISEAVSIPVIGIGGIHADNAGNIFRAGADGVAVISAVVSQPDITEAARAFKLRIRQFRP